MNNFELFSDSLSMPVLSLDTLLEDDIDLMID